jgi:hypothetical protein
VGTVKISGVSALYLAVGTVTAAPSIALGILGHLLAAGFFAITAGASFLSFLGRMVDDNAGEEGRP